MRAAVALLASLGYAHIAQAVAAESDAPQLTFDEHALLVDAESLARGEHGLLSTDEIQALRSAVTARASIDVDQLLQAKSHIEIIINPEGRVSARRTQVAAPALRCGSPSAWLVRIRNAGYVTAPLTVAVVKQGSWSIGVRGPVQASVPGTKLSGAMVEYRVMAVSMEASRQHDVTLLFSVGPASADIGARSEVALLLSCSSALDRARAAFSEVSNTKTLSNCQLQWYWTRQPASANLAP